MSLKQQAAQVAQKYNIPVNIFWGLIRAESSWNPNARSPAGAIGLTQVMPATARGMGYDPRQLAKSPAMQLEAGARYLSQMYKQFGDWELALAAYNAGPGRVRRAGNRIPNIRETQNYVPRVMRYAREYAEEASKYGDTDIQRPKTPQLQFTTRLQPTIGIPVRSLEPTIAISDINSNRNTDKNADFTVQTEQENLSLASYPLEEEQSNASQMFNRRRKYRFASLKKELPKFNLQRPNWGIIDRPFSHPYWDMIGNKENPAYQLKQRLEKLRRTWG